jgi:hypothetical protein
MTIAVIARRKDGAAVMRGGRYVSARKNVKAVARSGAWAITPFFGEATGFSGGYNVTHVGTGFCVFSFALGLGEARRALRRFAALPEQTRWRRLRNKGHMTSAMKADGMAARAALRKTA